MAAHPGNIWRIDARQIIAVLDRNFGLGFDLAAEMRQESTIRNVDEPDAFQIFHGICNFSDIDAVRDRNGNIAYGNVAARLNDVDGDHVSPASKMADAT